MKKLPASSLLEVLVSGVLLCIIVSISVMTFVNVTYSGPSFRHHHLDVMLQTRISDIKKERLVVRQQTDTIHGGSQLVETITEFKNKKNLFVITLEVMNVDGTIEAKANALGYQDYE